MFELSDFVEECSDEDMGDRVESIEHCHFFKLTINQYKNRN